MEGTPVRPSRGLSAAALTAALALAAAACTSGDDDERDATARPACVAAPAAAADGAGGASARSRPILFWREHPWPSLWSVAPDGTRLRREYVTNQNAKRPRLSPDGRWIAFDGAPPGKPPLTDFDVQVVRRDGSGRRTLAESTDWELDAAWSPDGKRLSFSRWEPTGTGDDWKRSEIWVVGIDGSAATRLGRGHLARWSPDGKMLVFAAPTSQSDGDLFVMNADGSGRCRLLATPEVEQPAGWSPDGKTILFTRYGADGADVFLMNVDGSRVRNLTRAPGFDIAGSWSPDGSEIVITQGNRPGTDDILLANADGSDLRSISRDRFYGSDPSW